MPKKLSVGVIGDFRPTYETHTATNLAFKHSADRIGVGVEVEWLPTPSLDGNAEGKMDRFDAFLCAPGSPYKSAEGALNGIRFARESDRPFLGTCGGCQNAIIEFARNVMGIEDAEHAEEQPGAENLFVTPLTCSLVGKIEDVKILSGSRAYKIYNTSSTKEKFYCNYGLNPSRRAEVEEAGLRVSGLDAGGEVRILELPKARFFFATLFVPQATSSPERPHPMITGLLHSALAA
jgi:CTP synthase (UTP-ammonia lyase)